MNAFPGWKKRTLESKLRGLHFHRGCNISLFVTELRNTVHELYDISEEKAINLIAINHVTSSLDNDIKESVRLLQLSGCATLEGILEIVQSKYSQTMSTPEISVASSSSDDRLSRLESLVEGLTNSLQALTTKSSAVNTASSKFLYDPGSQYTVIPSSVYQSLNNKPPLTAVNKVGIGISGVQFKFDGAAHLNLRFTRLDSTSYLLEYEPVLVSPYINTCIFRIHSELRFNSATRDHTRKYITFLTPAGRQMSMPYLGEKSDGRSAFIQVSKATIVPSNELCWVPGKVKGVNINTQNPDTSFLFEGQSQLEVELLDIKMNLTKKVVKMPVFNDGSEDLVLRKGVNLTIINVNLVKFQNHNQQ